MGAGPCMVQASADNEWESDNQSEEARMGTVCTNTNGTFCLQSYGAFFRVSDGKIG